MLLSAGIAYAYSTLLWPTCFKYDLQLDILPAKLGILDRKTENIRLIAFSNPLASSSYLRHTIPSHSSSLKV